MALAHQGIGVSQGQVLQDEGIDWRRSYYSGGVLHWGDPYSVFVGDPNGSEVALSGYGTYQPTIARVAGKHGALLDGAAEGVPPQSLYAAVLGGHPVVAWVSFDWAAHRRSPWVAFDGRSVLYAGPVEHAVTVVGVTASSVYVYNPWFGPQWVSRSTFQAAYGTYDDMAVIFQ